MLLDRTETVVFAALLDHLRNGSGLPVRRPGYAEPTYSSRPICHTGFTILPPDDVWYDVLTWQAPTQYMSVIAEYAASTQEALEGTSFRILVNGTIPSAVSLGDGVELSKDDTTPWPLKRRRTFFALDPSQVFTIQGRNPGTLPKTALVGIWGWSYDTVNTERNPTQGITDD